MFSMACNKNAAHSSLVKSFRDFNGLQSMLQLLKLNEKQLVWVIYHLWNYLQLLMNINKNIVFKP